MSERAHRSHEALSNALALAGKRAALAEQVGVSEGQLSKLLNGELATFCRILDALGLEIRSTSYIDALQRIAAEHLPRYSVTEERQ
ncbi:MAG: hypothetical protein KGL39_43020 [Patescibacteria group bacterium]|nr:hypothetical protein [Patescibacteria group bacterium]